MTIYTWAEDLYTLFAFTVIFPIILGLRSWRALGTQGKWVVVFLTVLLIHELLSELTLRLHIRNHFLYYFQTIAVLTSVMAAYYDIIRHKYLFSTISILITIGVFLEVYFFVGFNNINSLTLALSRLAPVVFVFASIKKILSKDITKSLINEPVIYIHSGFFLFGAFTAFNVYFKSYFIETSLDLYYFFDVVSAMAGAVSFGLFSYGFLSMKARSRPTF